MTRRRRSVTGARGRACFPRICCVRLLVLFCVVSGGTPQQVHAGPSTLAIEHLAGVGWTIDELRLSVGLAHANETPLTFTVRRLRFGADHAPLENIEFKCAAVAFARTGVRCAGGRYSFRRSGETYRGAMALEYNASTRAFRVELEVRGGGSISVTRTRTGALEIRGRAIHLAEAGPVLGAEIAALAGFAFDAGEIDFMLVSTSAPTVNVTLDATITGLTMSNPSGRIASEGLGINIALSAAQAAPDAAWAGNAAFSFSRGGVYAEPVYLDLGAYPVTATMDFSYAAADGVLALPVFTLVQDGVVNLSGRLLSTSAAPLDQLRINFSDVRFPAAYDSWLAGALVGTLLATLDSHGSASGFLEFRHGALAALSVLVDDLSIEDRGGRFAIYKLAAEINWAQQAADIAGSSVAWQGGFIYKAGFGAATLELGIAGAAIDLLEPARIPLLGGALALNTFTLRDYGSDALSLGLGAELEPIDLGQLTVALDWPPFSGQLSGRLPLLRYQQGVVTVGGNLEARAFDGDISIEQLRIEQPLGIVPVISGNIRLRNLDLEQVTEVVPFGRVSGRLDGDIDGLRLLKGEPIEFDARFRTPDNDKTRHRLSQRAVDTISRVAGGGAALSSTFLRVFKHFAYDKLGISCRLENDVCHMDGVEQADEGYYIVKGALVPRVDLIGRVREVRWSRLMQQLERALNEGEFKID